MLEWITPDTLVGYEKSERYLGKRLYNCLLHLQKPRHVIFEYYTLECNNGIIKPKGD